MKRALGVVLAILGVDFARRGATILFNLSDVTTRWIVASRDPDFRLDYGMFYFWGGVLSILLIALGVSTVLWGGGAAVRAKWSRRGWVGLTLLAIAAHLLLIPAKLFVGTLTLWTFVWFATVCAMYGAVWLESSWERDFAC